ncbi:hypothetical protein [Acetobacterium woodii]|uniref:Uncharacterized protein n=1 Tax=Acetobacterium woodii (strain ATCC 29683 / DSM 1030 / JCM 2381 / KCTC 1655 / WB1) TaxID=931626 RepID=H6LDY7_ACEWD|nr:hypothetical protein [Acetobacterium woodii]AFA48030.1 hypothetical protein Awo_c12460 [Acetobacterium woodii DSM 1030]
MALRYSSMVVDGKLNIRNEYIQTESGDFQKLTKNWIIKAYAKAKELNDTESMTKLENLKIDIWIPGENNELGKNITWCLKDEL